MKNFKKGGFSKGGDFGGRPKFGGDRKFGSKSFGDRKGSDTFSRPELFSAVCSSCGNNCEVPFRPTGDRPVFCRDCFGKKEQSGGQRFERSDRPERREFHSAPVGHAPKMHTGGSDELKKQIANLEYKLDRILKLLSEQGTQKSSVKKEVHIETVATPIVAALPKKTKTVAKKKAPAAKKAKKK